MTKDCFKVYKAQLFQILALTLVAFVIRIYYSLSAPTWADEMSVIAVSAQNSFKDLLILNHWDVAHPPLFYIYTRIVQFFFGFEHVPIYYLRLPMVVASSLAVVPIFLLGKKFLGNWGWVPAIWYVINFYQIRSGYSMRPYGFLQLLIPLAWLAAYQLPSKSKIFVGLINALFITMFYLDYATIWFFIPLFIYFFISKSGKMFFQIFYQLSPFLIGAALWLPIFILKLPEALKLESYLKTSLFEVINNLFGLFYYREITASFLALCALGLISSYVIIKKRKSSSALIPMVVFVPLIISYLYSLYVSPIMAFTNLIAPSIAVIFFICYGLSEKKARWLILLVLILVNLIQVNKIDWAQMTFETNRVGKGYQISDETKNILVMTDNCELGTWRTEVLYHFYKDGYRYSMIENLMIKEGKEIMIDFEDDCHGVIEFKNKLENDPETQILTFKKVGWNEYLLY